ncbi:MAG: carbonic anhydrase [Methylovulum sp.]|nr:carbonic anhydrase [Methylovulum sp.]
MQAFIHPALTRLFDGIKSFQQRFYGLEPANMQQLVEQGQHPKVLLIACSDSRVDPALLMDAAPGDLYVLRNFANLVPPYSIEGKHDSACSAIEYAVRDLVVEHIIILGHAQCGGIHALLGTLSGHKPQRDFIGDWVKLAMDGCYRYVVDQLEGVEVNAGTVVREADVENLCLHQHLVERAAIRGSLDNLGGYPWIKERVAAGKLNLYGWWFDLENGDLWATNEDNSAFLPVIE